MPRNIEQELDNIYMELQRLRAVLDGSTGNQEHLTEEGQKPEYVGHIQKMKNMHPDPTIMTLMDRLENVCGQSGQTGAITYLGVFESGNNQSSWIQNEINTDNLLSLIENKTAEKVLACIGNKDRLSILLSILKKPSTVGNLVEECGYSSTGQVYHHLRPLIAANLVAEDRSNRGVYSVVFHRVQGIIMLLAGISDMVDTKFSRGSWDQDDSIAIEIGAGLLPLVVEGSEPKSHSGLLKQISELREQREAEGRRVPIINVRDNENLLPMQAAVIKNGRVAWINDFAEEDLDSCSRIIFEKLQAVVE